MSLCDIVFFSKSTFVQICYDSNHVISNTVTFQTCLSLQTCYQREKSDFDAYLKVKVMNPGYKYCTSFEPEQGCMSSKSVGTKRQA